MKIILLSFLVFSSLSLFGQDNFNYQFGEDLRNSTYDINYLGESTYSVHKEAASGFVPLNRLYKRGISVIDEWTQSLNALYKVINVDNEKTAMGVTPKVTITFKLLRQDGSEWLTREDAITKLKKSKELLDLGVLTEAEFEKIRTTLIPLIK